MNTNKAFDFRNIAKFRDIYHISESSVNSQNLQIYDCKYGAKPDKCSPTSCIIMTHISKNVF